MKVSSLFSTLAFAGAAYSQSSPGAPYDISTYLPVSFNSSVLQPGALFQPDQVANSPSFGLPQLDTSTNQSFIAIIVDIDIVRNSSQPSNRSEFLHFLQTNLYSNSTSSNLTVIDTGTDSSSVNGVAYYPPSPPPNQVHNYNVLLFKQPDNFTLPSNFAMFNGQANSTIRAAFNVTQFANASGLGQPLAANYFRVLNGTAAQTSAVQTNTATSGVAFPSGFSFTTTPTGSTSASTTSADTTLSGTASSTTGSSPAAATSASAASESNFEDASQLFVKGVCLAVAATLPWIW